MVIILQNQFILFQDYKDKNKGALVEGFHNYLKNLKNNLSGLTLGLGIAGKSFVDTFKNGDAGNLINYFKVFETLDKRLIKISIKCNMYYKIIYITYYMRSTKYINEL